MNERRLREINERRAEIRDILERDGEVDIDALNAELDTLDTEEAELNRRIETAERLARNSGQGGEPSNTPNPAHIPNPITGRVPSNRTGQNQFTDRRAMRIADLLGVNADEAAERAEAFANEHRMEIRTDAVLRALTLESAGQIAQPTRVSGINPMQNRVSGIIDMVRVVDSEGMVEDAVAYQVDGLTGNERKDDGKEIAESEAKFAIARIKPTLISTIAYVSRNIQRTTPLNYQDRVSDAALESLRKLVSRRIVTGDPAATLAQITGILNAAAIEADSDISIGAIDAQTLRKIALAYGGDDNVEGGGVLLLNKNDLIAFGDIRGTNEKKAVYEIEFSENSTTVGKIIDGGLAVTFCINNALPSLADAKAGEYTMTYGKPLTYQLNLFGPYTVEVSLEHKFSQGLATVLGECMVGGNVTSQNGFLRVKKGASK